jgi:hypothetical protein
MRIAFLAAWVCFAVELVFVATMFITKNAGDDAAGRGVATGYGIVLLPLALITGALLFWGHTSSSKAVQWFALLVVAIPFLIAVSLWSHNALTNAQASERAAHGSDFADPRLTALAHLIEQGDPEALALQLYESSSIDWHARNNSNATLLGHAVRAVLGDTGGDRSVQVVQTLLAHGAPLTGAPTFPEVPLLSAVMHGTSPAALDLLRVLLKAGADPNTRDRDGLPLIHMTNSWRGVKKIELLAQYGADLQVPNNRTDRSQWTALMNAAYMQDWDLALYFLNHGIRPDYKAPDGSSLTSILIERAASYASYHETPSPGYRALETALRETASNKSDGSDN